MTEQLCDVALVGLAVMGQNLVLNMNDHGFRVVVYNRTSSRVDEFLAHEAKGTQIVGAYSLKDLVAGLKRPRKVFLMVKAGDPVDALLDELLPLLSHGDIVADLGNSHFADTRRRLDRLAVRGIHYLGVGVSGGEEGARHGPSIMPGGSFDAWPEVKNLLQTISARAWDGRMCCEWMGAGGAGHYVKMVHNGIEYGDMQVLAEAYQLLRDGAGLDNAAIGDVFASWNVGDAESYLHEIVADICRHREADGRFTLDVILDAAGQKGTGKWTVQDAADRGIPMTLVCEAVFARSVSSLVEGRTQAARVLAGPVHAPLYDTREAFCQDLGQAIFAAKIVSYAQGFMLMAEASKREGWALNLGHVGMVWRAGCIIRSRFLDRIFDAYVTENELLSFLVDDYFVDVLAKAQAGWRRVIGHAVAVGIPVPALSSSLSFYDAFRAEKLPANLIQAMRDYFGAHTYERTDAPRGTFFHTNWTGTGGRTASSNYEV